MKPIGKQKFERMCSAAGMQAVRRENINGADVCVADGFSATPHVTFKKFGIEEGQFPYGCYGTFWIDFANDDKLNWGGTLFCDAMHDSGHSLEAKRNMRVNAALADARETIARRKKAH